MDKSKFMFASKVVELSEEKDYLVLKNRVCYFNSPNLNQVQLSYDDKTAEYAQTLVNTPLVAKYIKRNGQDDLGGHEVAFVNGKYEFQTQAVGVNSAVDIVEEEVQLVDGSTAKLPCLYCTEILWTRFKNVTSAVKRLFAEGKLHNSWELKASEYTYKDGIKCISAYEFIGNCLLGTESYPAYGKSAAITELSEVADNYEFMAAESIGEALEMDIASMPASDINSIGEEENEIVEVNETNLENAEVIENTVEDVKPEETAEVQVQEENVETQPEVSENPENENSESEAEGESASESTEETSAMKTIEDVHKMIRAALRDMETEDEWLYVSMVFPVDNIVLCHNYKMDELQFVKFAYRIENDKAVLDNRENVELTISPLQINSEIESKNNAIAEANSRIVELESQVAELSKAKEELDGIKAERENAEHAEAVEKLRKYVENSGRFTNEELESEAIKTAIENLNEAYIKAEIADRLVASLAKEKKSENVETSETKRDVEIILSENDKTVTSEDVMAEFFKD